jgi:hypothetical protein
VATIKGAIQWHKTTSPKNHQRSQICCQPHLGIIPCQCFSFLNRWYSFLFDLHHHTHVNVFHSWVDGILSYLTYIIIPMSTIKELTNCQDIMFTWSYVCHPNVTTFHVALLYNLCMMHFIKFERCFVIECFIKRFSSCFKFLLHLYYFVARWWYFYFFNKNS